VEDIFGRAEDLGIKIDSNQKRLIGLQTMLQDAGRWRDSLEEAGESTKATDGLIDQIRQEIRAEEGKI
jgi:hypothetical protein